MTLFQDSIDRLYHAFSDQPRPGTIDACPCCVREEEICTLLAKPLKELTPGDLSHYASSALLTVGDVPDYLYFLPRILEISVTEDGWWPDPEVTGRAVAETQPSQWSFARRKALDELLTTVVNSLLEKPGTGRDIDSWICSISRMGLDAMPFLELISASPLHVVDFYEWNSESLAKGRLTNAFWERSSPGHEIVLSWFQSPRVGSLISRFYGLD